MLGNRNLYARLLSACDLYRYNHSENPFWFFKWTDVAVRWGEYWQRKCNALDVDD